MPKKSNAKVNVVDWMCEKGLIKNKEDQQQVMNAIRWFKRNIKVGDELVCLRRGVYEVDSTALEQTYKQFCQRRVESTKKKRERMKEINEQRRKRADETKKEEGGTREEEGEEGGN